jgi:hypothetical protein
VNSRKGAPHTLLAEQRATTIHQLIVVTISLFAHSTRQINPTLTTLLGLGYRLGMQPSCTSIQPPQEALSTRTEEAPGCAADPMRAPTRTVRINPNRVQIVWGDAELKLDYQRFWELMELLSEAALRVAEEQARARRGA